MRERAIVRAPSIRIFFAQRTTPSARSAVSRSVTTNPVISIGSAAVIFWSATGAKSARNAACPERCLRGERWFPGVLGAVRGGDAQ